MFKNKGIYFSESHLSENFLFLSVSTKDKNLLKVHSKYELNHLNIILNLMSQFLFRVLTKEFFKFNFLHKKF